MAEQVISTLTTKRREIEAHIGSLERDIEQARRDLSAILAAIKVFSGEGVRVTAYMNLARLFPRLELPRLAKEALQAAPAGLSTVAIALAIMTAKGLDTGDRHLRKAVAYKVVQVVRRWEKERKVGRAGKVGSVVVWRLSAPIVVVALPSRG